MNMNSIKWAAAFTCITFVFLFPVSHRFLIGLTEVHPYWMGFLKFSTLAFLGQLLGMRITNGDWVKPNGIVLRILAWGLMGTAIVFILPLAYQGVAVLQQQGFPLGAGNGFAEQFARAFTASVIFNLVPGPAVIIYHKLVESFIELSDGHVSRFKHIGLSDAVKNIDWVNLMQFVILRVNLILFIPLNTIIFLLPSEQRVLVAAYGSILLGVVLGCRRGKK